MHTKIGIVSLTLLLTHNIWANPINTHVNVTHEEVVKQYLADLQQADYKHIVSLFEKHGIVISTSRGKVDAKTFFYSFLPNVVSAKTELHQYFVNLKDSERNAARFHLNYQLKDGEQGNGEYVDEFIFSPNSDKLAAVYMFENLKFTTKSR